MPDIEESSSPKVELEQYSPGPQDPATARAAEKRTRAAADDAAIPSKRARTETLHNGRRNGVAPIKAEFLISSETANGDQTDRGARADRSEPRRKREKSKGQNTKRTFGSSKDAIALCMSRATAPEFNPKPCPFGDSCKYEHNLRRYLQEGKRSDLDTFNGVCPVWEARGWCSAGWRCRFAQAHSLEMEHEDGRKELLLLGEQSLDQNEEIDAFDVVNIVSPQDKIDLRKRKTTTPKAEAYTGWLNTLASESSNAQHRKEELRDHSAAYVEPPFLPSEKRRLYYGPETPILAPLTTQGNLPFRRLCVELGAQVTWSEMAMGLPLVQGEKAEWALMKAHRTELAPPKYMPTGHIVQDYQNSKDLKFGAQIAGNKPWVALKAAEVLTNLCPHLRAIDLNCGCPIDLVYNQGAGSALLDSPARLEKILRGMNAVSGEVPVTVKIRTGTKDGKPTAERLVERLAFGSSEAHDMGIGPPGVAAITLHGRSRQQRYTKSADWTYIAQCAALVKQYSDQKNVISDTNMEEDDRYSPSSGKMYFIGNGDCYSHEDYYNHIDHAKVDSVMVARGALIKPWIFEEIEKGQYLDKSAKERLEYIEKFARYGLTTWGSDEIGVGTTRRFLLEWLSFSCRYVPIGLLEHLPPRIQDRPPAYRSRDDLEALLGSDNYMDWIKISEMFLGPAHKDFHFEPKHKSNSYTEG